jgi:DNA-binding response OmpR family regulator
MGKILVNGLVAGGSRPGPSPNLRQHILVADGDKDLRRLNAEVLLCSGYKVDIAVHGKAAFEALQLQPYDLLIASDKMPGLSAIALVAKLQDAWITVPVVIVTRSLPGPVSAIRSAASFDATLQMPYKVDELLATVKSVLHSITQASGYAAPPPGWHSPPPFPTRSGVLVASF